MEYLSPERLELVYRNPPREVWWTSRPAEEPHQGLRQPRLRARRLQTADLVRVDVLINHMPVDAFSTIVHRSDADNYGRRMTEKLRELIPRQLFDVRSRPSAAGWLPARLKARPQDVWPVLRRGHHP